MQQPIIFRILCECIVPVSSLVSACPPHSADNNKQRLSSEGGKPALQLGNTTASCVTRCDSVGKPKAGEKVDDINFCLILINRVEVFCRLCFPMFHFYFAVSNFCKLHFFIPITTIIPLTCSYLTLTFLFLSLTLPFIVLH